MNPSELLAAVGILTAVVLILLMAAVPLLLDLPLGRAAPGDLGLRRTRRRSAARPRGSVGPRA